MRLLSVLIDPSNVVAAIQVYPIHHPVTQVMVPMVLTDVPKVLRIREIYGWITYLYPVHPFLILPNTRICGATVKPPKTQPTFLPDKAIAA